MIDLAVINLEVLDLKVPGRAVLNLALLILVVLKLVVLKFAGQLEGKPAQYVKYEKELNKYEKATKLSQTVCF